jgi:hypothetical protein
LAFNTKQNKKKKQKTVYQTADFAGKVTKLCLNGYVTWDNLSLFKLAPGNVQFGKKLAQGGGGIIYHGTTNPGIDVVIKSPDGQQDPEDASQRLLMEFVCLSCVQFVSKKSRTFALTLAIFGITA